MVYHHSVSKLDNIVSMVESAVSFYKPESKQKSMGD